MKKLLNKLIKDVEFAVIDLETTGFSSCFDRVIEVAAVKIRKNRISGNFQSLIYTDYIPYYATRVHGIDAEMVQDAPSLKTVRINFCKFIAGCVLVGHNIKSFDMPFLCNAFNINDSGFCVDTLKISRMIFTKERTHKLIAVAKRLGIESKRYHRALDDALVTAKVFLEFLNMEENRFKFLKDIVA